MLSFLNKEFEQISYKTQRPQRWNEHVYAIRTGEWNGAGQPKNQDVQPQ